MKARQTAGANDTVTMVATGTITALRMVNAKGAHEAAHEAVGVALYDTANTKNISVGVAPIEVVESGGACTPGGGLETDGDGKVVDWAVSGVIVGYAIDEAVGSGEFIRMLLTHGGNVA